jgi:mannose-6-phosphate isomerase-like protein (cupin superfamily)
MKADTQAREAPSAAAGRREEEVRWWLGALTVIKAGAADTGGRLAIVEVTEAPGAEAPLHVHHREDEAFLVLEGELRIDLEDGPVHLSPGELFVVPKGVTHKPYAEREAKVLLIEPRGVVNTGTAGGERTAVSDVWI